MSYRNYWNYEINTKLRQDETLFVGIKWEMVSAFMFDESMKIKSLFLYVCVSSHYIRIYKSYNQELSIDIQSIKQHVNVQFWVVDTDSILSTQSMFNCFKCFSTSGIIENVQLYLHASGCSRFVPLVFNAAFKVFLLRVLSTVLLLPRVETVNFWLFLFWILSLLDFCWRLFFPSDRREPWKTKSKI